MWLRRSSRAKKDEPMAEKIDTSRVTEQQKAPAAQPVPPAPQRPMAPESEAVAGSAAAPSEARSTTGSQGSLFEGARSAERSSEASAVPASQAPVASGEPLTREKLEELVVDALRTVYDPEIPVNIYDLGLIYDLRVGDDNKVAVKMTLTTPACPIAGQMPGMVEQAVRHVDNVTDCEVDLVWDPPWNPDMMTEAARLQLNI
jgi:FeS assembly SUF system protein